MFIANGIVHDELRAIPGEFSSKSGSQPQASGLFDRGQFERTDEVALRGWSWSAAA